MSTKPVLVWNKDMQERDREVLQQLLDETYQAVSWPIWHETVHSFDNSYPGAVRDIDAIRTDCLNAQKHNPHAQDLIRAASNDQILQMVYQTRARVYSEFQLVGAFRWVAYHENQRDEFRRLLSQRNFNAIRDLYSTRQNHNPNARHLLNAVSNLDIEVIVNAL
jgi:hypothetical protein